MAQSVKNPPATQETWVRSLSQEDPLEEGMATHSSILAWESPWTKEPSGLYYSPWGHKESDMTEQLSTAQQGEIKKTIPCTTTSKRINYQRINLMKEVKDLYTENYKTLLKETEDRKKDSTCP